MKKIVYINAADCKKVPPTHLSNTVYFIIGGIEPTYVWAFYQVRVLGIIIIALFSLPTVCKRAIMSLNFLVLLQNDPEIFMHDL